MNWYILLLLTVVLVFAMSGSEARAQAKSMGTPPQILLHFDDVDG